MVLVRPQNTDLCYSLDSVFMSKIFDFYDDAQQAIDALDQKYHLGFEDDPVETPEAPPALHISLLSEIAQRLEDMDKRLAALEAKADRTGKDEKICDILFEIDFFWCRILR